MRETDCPGKNLEFILLGLNPQARELMNLEPSIEDIREFRNDRSEEEINEEYRLHLSIYNEDQKQANEIRKLIEPFGKDYEEVKQNLKAHFNECERCRQTYLKNLDDEAEFCLKFSAKHHKVPQNNYIKLIRKYDFLEYLND